MPASPAAAKIAAVETSALVWTGTALLAGLAFGYCAQRGGFCLTRALSNWVLMGDTAILRAVQRINALGYPAAGDDRWQIPLVNQRYGTNFAEASGVTPGNAFGFADWLYGS